MSCMHDDHFIFPGDNESAVRRGCDGSDHLPFGLSLLDQFHLHKVPEKEFAAAGAQNQRESVPY